MHLYISSYYYLQYIVYILHTSASLLMPSISTKNVDRTLSSNPDDAFLSSVRQLTNESKKKLYILI